MAGSESPKLKPLFIASFAILIIIIGATLLFSNSGDISYKSDVFAANVSSDDNSITSKVESAGSSISFDYETPTIKQTRDGEASLYEISNSTSIKYEIKNDAQMKGLKETIILKDKNAPNEFNFDVRLENVADFKPDPDRGSWHFYDKDGKEVFYIPAGFMVDSKGSRSEDVKISIARDGSNYSAKVTADKSWLQDPQRAYPIEIDPSVIVSGGIAATDTQFGSLQRKVTYANSNWYAFYSDVVSAAGAAVKIDDASNFGALPNGGPQIVRTSSGTLYAAFRVSGGFCEIWKSSDGSSWTEQDSAGSPDCDNFNPVSIAIDSDDLIHMVYSHFAGTKEEARYVVFDTSTDTFGTSELVYQLFTNDVLGDVAIAVDSNDKPHVIFAQTFVTTGALEYSNRISGSWSAKYTIEICLDGNCISPSLAINEDNIPEVSYISTGDQDLTAGVGNANNTTSFTLQDVDTTVFTTPGTAGTSIGIDSSGNTWIAYIDENGATDYTTLVKHNDGDGWGTWQSPVTNSNAGKEPTLAINGTDVYVFYTDENNDIAYDKYTGSWSGETVIETGTYQDAKAKWSYYFNNQGSLQIDYLFSDNTDVYWNKVVLGGSGVFYKKSTDGVTWGSAVDVDTTDSDDYNPTVWQEGSLIYTAWIDDDADAIEINTINTASSDALGTKCTSADLGSIANTFMVSNAVADDGTVYLAYSDTGGDTEAGVYKLTFAGCSFTDITAGESTVTTVFATDPSNPYGINSTSTTYSTARASGTLSTENNPIIGQVFINPNYFVGETFFIWDTSGVPDNDTISAVVLSVHGKGGGDLSTTDFTVIAALDDFDGGPVVTGDWVNGSTTLPGLTQLATFATSGGWLDSYNVFSSTADILTAINKTGNTAFVLYSSRQAGNNTPTGEERVSATIPSSPDKDPKLVITHAPSMLSAGDRPVLVTVGNNLHMVSQDGNLSYSAYNGTTWTTTDTTIASVTDNNYSLTTDGTNLWLLTVASSGTATNFYEYDGASWSAPTAPWTSETNVLGVSLTYDSGATDLYASIIKDASEQAYYKTTDTSSISWSSETSFDFTPGDVSDLSMPLAVTSFAEFVGVARQGSNFESTYITPTPTPTPSYDTRIDGNVRIKGNTRLQ